jgi:uncharacterized protein DUF4913
MTYDRESEPSVFEPESAPAEEPKNPEVLFFPSLEVFVTEYLAPLLRRRLNRSMAVWCPKWWAHPEAVARLTSLWRAFEYLRRDPALGMSMWWTHHADPHLRALMSPDFGPFVSCDPRDGHTDNPPGPLPLTPVPPGLLDHSGFRVEHSLYADLRAGQAADSGPDRPRTGFPKDKVLNKNLGF